jgi:hypothetical protein
MFSVTLGLEKERRKDVYLYTYNIEFSVMEKKPPAEDNTFECDAVGFIKFCTDKKSSHSRTC